MIRLILLVLALVASTLYFGFLGFILSAVTLSAYLADLTIKANDQTERVTP